MTVVEQILDLLDTLEKKPWRILIDGPSGSGKTTLANQLQERTGATVLHLDDMYAGWEGMAEGSGTAGELLAGTRTSFRRWDWEQERWGDEITPDPTSNWIIEGCGAATKSSVTQADLVVWAETDPEVARQRGIDRDGPSFRRWWDAWHRQEVDHWRENDPRSLADLVVQT